MDTVWSKYSIMWLSFTPLFWLGGGTRRPLTGSGSKQWRASLTPHKFLGLISRVASNLFWLFTHICSMIPGKVDRRNVENVKGQKKPCRKFLLCHISLCFGPVMDGGNFYHWLCSESVLFHSSHHVRSRTALLGINEESRIIVNKSFCILSRTDNCWFGLIQHSGKDERACTEKLKLVIKSRRLTTRIIY